MSETEERVELDTTHAEQEELAMFREALLTGELEVDIDPAVVMARIAERIMDSPDLEAAFKEPPLWSAKDQTGTPYELRRLNLHASKFEGGGPVFASVDAVDLSTGEVGVLNTSAVKHLAKLYVMARDHAFPVKVRITQSIRPTAGGFYPLDFELIEEEGGA